MTDDPVVLYLLMRNDMLSLNPGKACAQAHHAGTQMLAHDSCSWGLKHLAWLGAWSKEASGFGTVLCLGASDAQIDRSLQIAQALDLPNARVLDPTYPLLDGDTLHLIPVVTCAYIFGPKTIASAAVQNLGLMP